MTKTESTKRNILLSLISKYDKYLMLLFFIVISAVMSDKFFTSENLTNLLKQNAAIGIVAFGELLVILTGGIDLSVGAIASLSGIMVATFLKDGMAWPIASLLAIGVGTLAGFANGLAVTIAKITPFIVTLASMTVYQGIGLLMSKGRQVFFKSPDFLVMGREYFWGIPVVAWIWLVIALVVALFLGKTIMGRFIRGIGGNKEAVRLAGISTVLYETMSYTLSGLLCGVAGVIMTSRLTLGTNVMGQGWELIAIASVMVGGGNFNGGIGSVGGTVVGVIILGLIGNIMNLLGISIYWQQIIRGLIILLAVFSSSRKKVGSSA
ncbi:MAG TPA: ABC transporter permease [Mesotoga sp.]|jgi:ribose/xylose/arabinose/galactoside ABC-type transport system permease subunit|nr:ABC transporter permease [Mesotoga sp.]